MNPLQYLMGLRGQRAKQMGMSQDAVQAPNADTGAFPTLTDPSVILDYMTQQNEAQHEANEGFASRGRAVPMSPGEADELNAAKNYGIPTMWGKIMQRRHGGIQGRGIAGALGKSVNPAAGPPSRQRYENEALAAQYPFAELLKRFR